MAKWYLWPRINQKATTFLTDNLSQDDPYLLYAALHSGINTKVISRDMMRSHLYLLKDHRHKRIFNRWLSENRYELQHVSQNGRVILKVNQCSRPLRSISLSNFMFLFSIRYRITFPRKNMEIYGTYLMRTVTVMKP